jgi:carboxyl-terminal processing protease
MIIKRAIIAPVLVATAAMATGGWFLQKGLGQDRTVYANARLFEDVLRYASEAFVDKKDPPELYRMAIDGMLQELGDPHTVLMDAKDYESLRLQTEGEYGGIGVQIDKRDGWITVIAPLPGTPGERAGLRAGDRIIEVNDSSTKEWKDTQYAVERLRGPKGSTVRLKIVRSDGSAPIPITIVREEIRLKAVPAKYVMNGNVGYIELVTFSESSTTELREGIRQLVAQGAKGIIFDMRRNPGGLLDQGIAISDMFLKRGVVLAETKGRIADSNQRVISRSGDQFPGLPIVVLVEPSSASASEIVAGALQDHDRALVLGRTTYGKGSVQTLVPLEDNFKLKITTARWYTPVGRSIQKPYGIGASSEAVDTLDEDADTVKPKYKTDSGRTVYGGGGIVPDVTVMPDTLTTDEQVYRRALEQSLTQYINARLAFAVEFIRQNPNLTPEFEVTPAMLGAFYNRMTQAGVKVDRTSYDRAARWVKRDIGVEITFSKWGEEAARKRVNADDPQIMAAADLLRKATTPASLFTLGDSFNASRPKTAGVNKTPAPN